MKLEFTAEKRYIVFPASRHAKKKTVILGTKDGECLYDIDIRIDNIAPEYEVYVDIRRFSGRELTVSSVPETKLSPKFKDRRPVCRFSEPLRPKYHFTAPEGWINDPNGLVYADGVYHIYYQHNPADTGWGNMHWAHATSTDLVNWDYRNEALFPDSDGAAFSGGAVADDRDILGMKDTVRTPLVLFYTAAGGHGLASKGKSFTQCIAVSRDGGETYEKWSGNPIIGHIEAANRDPKVVYSQKYGKYIMSLYLDGDRYAVFCSEELTKWEKLCELSLPFDNECPALFPMLLDGREEKWVLMGAHDRYTVYDFDGKSFTPLHEGSRVFNYTEPNTYAAQRFEGLQSGRNVRIAWMKTDFARFGAPFNGAFTFPQEMTLVTYDGVPELRVLPASDIVKLRGVKNKKRLCGRECVYPVRGISHEFELLLDTKKAKSIKLFLFGTEYGIDIETMTVSVEGKTAPISFDGDGLLKLRLLTDTCGIELFVCNGRAYMASIEIPDENLSELSVVSDSEITIKLCDYKLRTARKTDLRR